MSQVPVQIMPKQLVARIDDAVSLHQSSNDERVQKFCADFLALCLDKGWKDATVSMNITNDFSLVQEIAKTGDSRLCHIAIPAPNKLLEDNLELLKRLRSIVAYNPKSRDQSSPERVAMNMLSKKLNEIVDSGISTLEIANALDTTVDHIRYCLNYGSA